MADCNKLGISAVADRKKFLMLTRSLRSQDTAPPSPRTSRSNIPNYSSERPRRDSTVRSRPNSAYLDDLTLVDEEEEDMVKYTKSNQLVNAYGIPVSNRRKQSISSIRVPDNVTSSLKMSTPVSPSHRSNLNQKIRVCVRKRPLSSKEMDRKEKDITHVTGDRNIQVNEPK
jgi:kinesin family protein 2/24